MTFVGLTSRMLQLCQSYAASGRPSKLFTVSALQRFNASADAQLDRDRVTADGSLRPGKFSIGEKAPATPYVIGSSTNNGRTAPIAPPVSQAQLDELAEFVAESRGLVVITGAGASTESNVPDYRSPNGAYSTGFKPMTHQQFMASPENRSRYWARSFAGWFTFKKAKPNPAHDALARLEKLGWVKTVITQNVDRLHHKAGSLQVIELHGTTHEVECQNCGAVTPREDLQRKMADLNPEAAAAAQRIAESSSGDKEDSISEQERLRLERAGTSAPLNYRNLKEEEQIQRPDGDVELSPTTNDLYSFKVPPCDCCGGILKPHVVFFGDSVPQERAQQALDLAQEASHVLAVGTSLAVWSAYRLAKAAVDENNGKLGIVNVGPTRADELASMKVVGLVGETLIRLAAHPTLLVPPGG